jgi:hypothetical protein
MGSSGPILTENQRFGKHYRLRTTLDKGLLGPESAHDPLVKTG